MNKLVEIQEPVFQIGSIPIMNRIILAPMDGYTDHPFRLICRQWGSGCIYSEFINGMDIENHHPYLDERVYFQDNERPFGFQILDNSPERILNTARQLRELNPDFFDVNFGCCGRTVCSRGAGASLLLDPQKISHIIELLVKEVDIPITAKIRLGWDEKNRNYLENAKRIEDAGASMLAVHGRTKSQAYTGNADWDAISAVKQNLHIPVVGNGDVRTVSDIHKFLAFTKCDGVMIGRAAIGNPWIFSLKNRSDCSNQEIFNTLEGHLHASLAYYGLERGLILFRKHAVQYLQNDWPSSEFRREVLTSSEPEDVLRKISKILFP